MTPQDLIKLANGLSQMESNDRVYSTIENLNKLKPTTPFSARLNEFIQEWYDRYHNVIVFTETDDFDENDIEGTLRKHIARFKQTGKIHVWTGSSDNTIFGDPSINHMFRAWHDYIHINCNYGYDFIGESIVADIQKSMLPRDWYAEKELIHCEVVGQAQYYMKHKEFLKNQRLFTKQYFYSPYEALKLKQ